MNLIGDTQCGDILDSFLWDSTGHQESNSTRKKERADSHIFYFRDWFNIMTSRGLGEGRYFRIYENICLRADEANSMRMAMYPCVRA